MEFTGGNLNVPRNKGAVGIVLQRSSDRRTSASETNTTVEHKTECWTKCECACLNQYIVSVLIPLHISVSHEIILSYNFEPGIHHMARHVHH